MKKYSTKLYRFLSSYFGLSVKRNLILLGEHMTRRWACMRLMIHWRVSTPCIFVSPPVGERERERNEGENIRRHGDLKKIVERSNSSGALDGSDENVWEITLTLFPPRPRRVQRLKIGISGSYCNSLSDSWRRQCMWIPSRRQGWVSYPSAWRSRRRSERRIEKGIRLIAVIGEVRAKCRLVPIQERWDPNPGTRCTLATPRYYMLSCEM